MQEILIGNNLVIKMLGKQPQGTNSRFRLITFSIFQKCDSGWLLYNAITGKLLLLTDNEYEIINDCHNYSIERLYNSEFLQSLIQQWFLIPDIESEYEIVKQIRRIIKSFCDRNELRTYTILPTTDCNARCFYCFEADYPHYSMSPSTMVNTIDFIKSNYRNKPFLIRWFGGEPLLEVNTIDSICEKLNYYHLQYRSRIVTNGFLFSESVIQRAVSSWHLEEAMVTLDGLEQQYNTVKNYRNNDLNQSPFQIVCSNIELLLKANIFVEIRLNIDFHNLDSIDALIQYIYCRYKDFENFHVFTVILHCNGKTAVPHTRQVLGQLFAAQRQIEQKLYTLGIGKKEYASLPAMKINMCMADATDSVVINPLGQLAKCDASIFAGIVGDLLDGVQDCSYWQETKKEAENCESCPVFPICGTLQKCNAYSLCDSTMKDQKIGFIKDSMLRAWDSFKRKEAGLL